MSHSATDWQLEKGEKWVANLQHLDALLAPVDAPLISALGLDRPYRVADIGCGGGATTVEIQTQSPAGTFVHGFDVSGLMVEAARDRVRRLNLDIWFDEKDVANSLPDHRYDRLCSRFGVMFFDEPARAFANLSAWLNRGARFAFAVWADPAANPWMTTVRDAVASVVELDPPEPDAPGPFRYADSESLLSVLSAAGFKDLATQSWRNPLPIGGNLAPARAADVALSSFATFATRLEKAGPDAYAAAKQRLTSAFEPHYRGDAVWMDAAVHIVTGGV
ncbi:MAG: class I SAM-dependent methyltransferase [Myxococcota bacterium]